MKKWILGVMAICIVAGAAAQDMTSYFMESSVARMRHNAAFAPSKGYLAVPVVGATSISTTGSIAVGDILYPHDGSLVLFADTRLSADAVLANLSESVNTIGAAANIGLLNMGWYSKNRRSFLSFDLNLRATASAELPYEFFEFMKSVPTYSNIPEFSIYAEAYTEAAVGYSFPISERLYLGFRLKGLFGLAGGSLNVNNTTIKLAADEWSGAMTGLLSYDVAGVGAAIDFGAEYALLDNLRISAAVNDLGAITWYRGNNTTQSVELDFSYSGVDVNVGGDTSLDSEMEASDIYFGEFSKLDQPQQGSTRMLQTSINAGVEYLMWRGRCSIGAIYQVNFWSAQCVHSGTGVFTFKPVQWVSLAASYGYNSVGSSAMGVALNLYTPVLRMYASTDILLSSKMPTYYVPIDQSAMNITVGLSFPIGRQGIRHKAEWRQGVN